MPRSEWLSITEMGNVIGVCRNTAYKIAKNGVVPIHLIPGTTRKRVRYTDVVKVLEQSVIAQAQGLSSKGVESSK